MSEQLINHSPDLRQLRNEGFDIEIRKNYLLIKDVPYVNSKKEIKRGILISELDLAGDITTTPRSHVVYFSGEYPCNDDGTEIVKIKCDGQERHLDTDLVSNSSFSSKPPSGYKNYYDKMTAYVDIISHPAQSVDENVTAKTFPVIKALNEESVFQFIDTASSRAGINTVTNKLKIGKIGIVGLGGTGSYVLDLVAKTPVKEIHLFDGDVLSQHNAFRSPGTPTIDELQKKPLKVDYFRDLYSRIHRGIFAHGYNIQESNVDQLSEMDFVFLCIDIGEAKLPIVGCLEKYNKPFIDVGMGISLVGDSLLGIVRITTSTNEKRDHVRNNQRIPFSSGGNNDYGQNIQIADLNALNASLAVIKWKKIYGFYLDYEKEFFATYTIDGNKLISEDRL